MQDARPRKSSSRQGYSEIAEEQERREAKRRADEASEKAQEERLRAAAVPAEKKAREEALGGLTVLLAAMIRWARGRQVKAVFATLVLTFFVGWGAGGLLVYIAEVERFLEGVEPIGFLAAAPIWLLGVVLAVVFWRKLR